MLLDLKNLVLKYNLQIKGVLHIGAHWGGDLAGDVVFFIGTTVPNSIYENFNKKKIYFATEEQFNESAYESYLIYRECFK